MSRIRQRTCLNRNNAWRIQADAEGAEVRVVAPRGFVAPPQRGPAATLTRAAPPPTTRDPRIPASGSAIVREYKGQTIRVLVRQDAEDFECDGERYKTLSGAAKHITGFRLFWLGQGGGREGSRYGHSGGHGASEGGGVLHGCSSCDSRHFMRQLR